MAVLVRHRVSGMTPEQYDQSAPPLIEKLKTAPGFLYHVAFVDEGGTLHGLRDLGEQGATRPLVQRERRGSHPRHRAASHQGPRRRHALGRPSDRFATLPPICFSGSTSSTTTSVAARPPSSSACRRRRGSRSRIRRARSRSTRARPSTTSTGRRRCAPTSPTSVSCTPRGRPCRGSTPRPSSRMTGSGTLAS